MSARPAAIKKIDVAELRPGMYIADLGADWLSHNFVRNNFHVGDDVMVLKVRESGLREVYIDTLRGLDVPHAPTRSEVERELDAEIIGIAAKEKPVVRVSHGEEIARAEKIRSQANAIVHDMLRDARLGQQVRAEQAAPVVEHMAQSILRNGGALLSLCRVKNKDDYTFQHSVSICALLIAFCGAVDMDAAEIRLGGMGGLLHDIGKIRVPNEVLNKPGKLDDEEFEKMRSHVVESRDILAATAGIDPMSILIAHQHHERYDGSGYPLGLKGDEISRIGQMAAICDVYDAITSDRCYHKGMAPHEALRKLLEWSKFHFNPALVQQFIRVIGIYPVGTLVMLESGRLAQVIDQSEKNLLQPLLKVFYDTKRQIYVEPRRLDLSRSVGFGGGDKIVSHETPEKWGISPAALKL